jgi:hypothetical protein
VLRIEPGRKRGKILFNWRKRRSAKIVFFFAPRLYLLSDLPGQQKIIRAHATTTIRNRIPRPPRCPCIASIGVILIIIIVISLSFPYDGGHPILHGSFSS